MCLMFCAIEKQCNSIWSSRFRDNITFFRHWNDNGIATRPDGPAKKATVSGRGRQSLKSILASLVVSNGSGYVTTQLTTFSDWKGRPRSDMWQGCDKSPSLVPASGFRVVNEDTVCPTIHHPHRDRWRRPGRGSDFKKKIGWFTRARWWRDLKWIISRTWEKWGDGGLNATTGEK